MPGPGAAAAASPLRRAPWRGPARPCPLLPPGCAVMAAKPQRSAGRSRRAPTAAAAAAAGAGRGGAGRDREGRPGGGSAEGSPG